MILPETYRRRNHRTRLRLLLMVLMVLVVFVLNILWGSVSIPVSAVLGIISGATAEHAAWEGIIIHARLPQAVTALLAGAALGIAGLMMQTLFRNPLAGPSVLGISSGASLGVAVMMLFIALPTGKFIVLNQVTGNLSVIVAAFAGAYAVLLVIAAIAARFRSNTMVLIIGIMIAYAVTAIVGVLQFYSLKEDLQAFIIWGLGSFANVSWPQLRFFIPVITLGMLASALMIKPMNALLLGEHYAANLGVRVGRSRIIIILITGVLTATVTAYCGPIAFLGLAVPHLSRNLFQTSDHLVNVPGTILSGALLALVCNLIARMPGFDGALPINAITSLIGAPVVVWIIINRHQFKHAA
ncbi:MAG: iron chelate uptake ABC transporter family permease subunit [Bacteroidales bacterium]